MADLKGIRWLFNAINNHHIEQINRRMMTDKDVYSGRPNIEIDTANRIENPKRIQTTPIKNSSTILYKIEQLEYKLKNSNLSEKERSAIKKHINLLYEEYEEFLDKEKSSRYNSSLDNSR